MSDKPLNLDLIEQTALGVCFHFAEIDSTNAFLLKHCRHLPNGSVCIAETQLVGRGRRGRTWYSPRSQNLYLSLFWHYGQNNRQDLSALSLVVAMAIVKTLKQQQIPDLQIKWPNDIYFQGKKMGGILIESKADQTGIYLVIGIGLNLGMAADTATEQVITQPWSDLAKFQLDRSQYAAELVRALQQALLDFPQTGFAPYVAQWQAMDFLANQPVQLHLEQETLCGIAQGINEKGELLLQQGTQLTAFAIGEISVRKSV